MEKKKKRRIGIFPSVFRIIVSLLIFYFIFMVLFSTLLINKFYDIEQKSVFRNVYKRIEKIDDFNINSKDFKTIIDLTRLNNCIIEVYDTNTNTRIYSPYIYENDNFSNADSKKIFDKIIGFKSDVCIINDNFSENQKIINSLNNQNNNYSMLIRKNNHYYILIQTSTEHAFEYKILFIKSLIICLILASAGGVILALILSKDISHSINSIKRVAKKISEKDFSEKCNENKISEFYDLSEYINKMAKSLKEQIDDIEERNKTLNDDIKKRKELEESQKNFVSNVSHELKTPISIISGYSEGIKYGLVKNEKEINEYCDVILNECKRMTNIVKQLLNLSILENETIKLDIKQNNISEMLNIVLQKYEKKYLNRIFINSITPNLTAYFDYYEIENVIINFIDNAIKYSTKEIDIRAFIDGDYIYIGVHSIGNKISYENSEKIWERFYRLDKSHKRNENSTGLGLSIVKATMLKHEMPYGYKNINNGNEFFIKVKKNI